MALRDVLPVGGCLPAEGGGVGVYIEAEWEGEYRQDDRARNTAIVDAANVTTFLTASHLAHAGRG
jgi:hypothetical protein